jgi:hypothetical protein
MLKLSFSYDSVRFILLKILTELVISVTFCVIFQFLSIFNTIVGAGAASRYGSGQIMRLLAALATAPQHCTIELETLLYCTVINS